MAKNGHNAKAIAHAKYSVLVKKIKLPKTCEKRFHKPRAIIGQRGSLPVRPLGYLNFKKVIFRTMRTMRKQFPVVPRTTH